MTAPAHPADLPPPPAVPLGTDADLVRRHAPILRLDSAEPFRPVAVGATVYRSEGKSVSSKFDIAPAAGAVVEYAIYWDHDIQHSYDLEHVWVRVDDGGQVDSVEGSQHGQRLRLSADIVDGRPMLCAEPGKHALFARAGDVRGRAGYARKVCGPDAGDGGIHTSNLFGPAAFGDPSPTLHRLARRHLERLAFAPAFDAAIVCDLLDCAVMPWDDMAAWIPHRIRALGTWLPQAVPHLAAVFLDCGDTLVDEGTEVKEPDSDVVLSAELVDGAPETLSALRSQGYPLVLVADGPRRTFENVLGHHGLWDLFDAHITSGDIGVPKPSPKMFEAALRALGLPDRDAGRTVMVGNNLERDIRGANDFGIASVFFDWSDRRRRTPNGTDEVPDHTIRCLGALPDVIDDIERELQPGSGIARVPVSPA